MECSWHAPSTLVTRILRYLLAHPDAKDTIDGIARWWIGPAGDDASHPEWNRSAVQEAVDDLVARGWVVRRETTSSHVVYGLDKRHLAAIARAIASDD